MVIAMKNRARRRRSLVLTSVALALTGLASSASGAQVVESGPTLDRSFGHSGRVVVHFVQPVESGLPAEILADKGGSISVPTGDYIFRYRPDGRPDLGFGNGGRLRIVAPESGLDLEPKFLLPEGGGRFTVGGTTERLGGFKLGLVLQAWPTVRRYGPAGRPDPAFGQAGVFMSDLGFPPLAPYVWPENSGGLYEISPEVYGSPHVFLEGLSAAGGGGYLLEGEGVLTETACVTQLFPRTYQPFTARLTPDGTLDPSFGEGGVEKEPVIDLDCGVIQNESTEGPSEEFIGTPKHARAIATDSGVDARGRTTLLDQVFTRVEGGSGDILREYLVRLTRAGGFDPSFGDGGKVRFTPPEGPMGSTEISVIHVAADGRVLIVGTTHTRDRPKGTRTDGYLLGEVDPSGHLVRRGGRAFTTIGLGRGINPNPPTILPDGHGRLLLWTSFGVYKNRGFALARVKPGH
jgi:Domain of unknown function (DUF5122) beta-propeller